MYNILYSLVETELNVKGLSNVPIPCRFAFEGNLPFKGGIQRGEQLGNIGIQGSGKIDIIGDMVGPEDAAGAIHMG